MLNGILNTSHKFYTRMCALAGVVGMFLLCACGGDEKILNVGLCADYPPYETIKDGKVVGFDVDIANKLGEVLGYKRVNIINMDFNGLIPALQAKKVDMVISALSATEDRRKSCAFSKPYAYARFALIFGNDTKVTKVEDLYNYTIGAQLGSTMQKWIEDNIEMFSKAPKFLANNILLIKELENKNLNLVLIEEAQAQDIHDRFNLDYVSIEVDEDEKDFGLCVAVPLSEQSTLGKINDFLDNNQGFLNDLHARWFPKHDLSLSPQSAHEEVVERTIPTSNVDADSVMDKAEAPIVSNPATAPGNTTSVSATFPDSTTTAATTNNISPLTTIPSGTLPGGGMNSTAVIPAGTTHMDATPSATPGATPGMIPSSDPMLVAVNPDNSGVTTDTPATDRAGDPLQPAPLSPAQASITNSVNSAMEVTKDTLNKTTEAIKDTAVQAKDMSVDAGKKIAQAGKDVAVKTAEVAKKSADKAKEVAKEVAKKAGTAVKDTAKAGAKKVAELAKDAKDNSLTPNDPNAAITPPTTTTVTTTKITTNNK